MNNVANTWTWWSLALLVAIRAQACTPVYPEPTLSQTFKASSAVYLARLLDSRRAPFARSMDPKREFYEDAEFEVIVAFKGAHADGSRLKTRTLVAAGGCALNVQQPVVVLEKNGAVSGHAYSDIWLLFLNGPEPFRLQSSSYTLPVNLLSESDIREVFRLSETK